MKTWLKKFFEFYLYGNFHIAFCAAAITHLTCTLFHLGDSFRFLAIAFLGTISFYSFQRLVGVLRKEDYTQRDERHQWNYQNKNSLIVLTILPALPLAWLVLQLHFEAQLVLAGTGLLSLVYASPIIPVKRKWMRLRDFPAVKVFFISLVWAAVTIWIPLMQVFPGFGWETVPGTEAAAWAWSTVIFLVVLGLTIPFDVRDLIFDPESIRTIPMIIGEKNAVRLAQFCILAACGIFYFVSKTSLVYFSFSNLLAFALWSAFCIWILNDCSSKKNEYYFSFVIDGMLILLWAFLTGQHFIQ